MLVPSMRLATIHLPFPPPPRGEEAGGLQRSHLPSNKLPSTFLEHRSRGWGTEPGGWRGILCLCHGFDRNSNGDGLQVSALGAGGWVGRAFGNLDNTCRHEPKVAMGMVPPQQRVSGHTARRPPGAAARKALGPSQRWISWPFQLPGSLRQRLPHQLVAAAIMAAGIRFPCCVSAAVVVRSSAQKHQRFLREPCIACGSSSTSSSWD